jgi:hypothetical protein
LFKSIAGEERQSLITLSDGIYRSVVFFPAAAVSVTGSDASDAKSIADATIEELLRVSIFIVLPAGSFYFSVKLTAENYNQAVVWFSPGITTEFPSYFLILQGISEKSWLISLILRDLKKGTSGKCQ